MRNMRLTLAQLRSHLYDKKENIYRIALTVAEASKNQQSDYVLFPELFLTGYSLDGKVAELAEPIDGDSVQQIQRIASQNSTGIIIGFPEKYNDKIYNTALFIDPTGEIQGVYRKTHLFDFENDWFSLGESFPIFETPFGKVGLMITYDMEFPEVARILALKGAQIILVLAANMVPYQMDQRVYIKARAMENHTFIALSNKTGLEGDHIFFGESEIIGPTGKTLYRSANNEDVATVEIDFLEMQESKEKLDYLSYRRSELYRNEGL